MEVFGLGVEVEETRKEFTFRGETLVHVPGHGPVTDKRGVEADRDPDIPADDLLYEARFTLNRVAASAASLYACYQD